MYSEENTVKMRSFKSFSLRLRLRRFSDGIQSKSTLQIYSESNFIDVLALDEGLNRLLCLGLGISIDIESLISILSGSANTLLCYKIFQGKVLRFMSGFRHIEQVKDCNTSKSLCNPMDNTIILFT
jgi:hypothetical protein